MHPILFQIEAAGHSRSITSYGVFAVLGILSGAFLIIRLAKRDKIATFDALNMIALLVAGGIIVSLFTHFIIFLPERLAEKNFFDLQFGVVSWGGVLGGALAALYVSRAYKIPLLRLADHTLPGVALGFAFGRVGCHFAGCCFGLHYEGPLQLTFSHPLAPAAANLQPLFPIQLLSALLLLGLCILLVYLQRLRLRRGSILIAYALLYGIGRFIIEFYRADARGVYFGFSDAQWYAACLVIAGCVLSWRVFRAGDHKKDIHAH